MMSSSFSSLLRRFGALPVLLAALSCAIVMPAHAADETDTGGTFTSPGYPPRNVRPGDIDAQPGGALGNAPGQLGARPGTPATPPNGLAPPPGRDAVDNFP